MPASTDNSVTVPDPSDEEQVRLLAEAVADMRSILAVLADNAHEFMPGAAASEMKRAFEVARPRFDRVLNAILTPVPATTETGQTVLLTSELLEANQLTGAVGLAKVGLLRRLKERFLNRWVGLPSTGRDVTPAVRAGMQYLEGAANVAASIPGAGAIEELLQLFKQYLGLRVNSDG